MNESSERKPQWKRWGVIAAALTLLAITVVLAISESRSDSTKFAVNFLQQHGVLGPSDKAVCLKQSNNLIGASTGSWRFFEVDSASRPSTKKTARVRIISLSPDQFNSAILLRLQTEDIRLSGIKEVQEIQFLDDNMIVFWITDGSGRAWIWHQVIGI
jgi:hypothetical protein